MATAVADRFAELVDSDRVPEANLFLASLVRPDLDLESVRDRMEAMAGKVEGDTHLSLRRVISIAEGIGGNFDDYYHPDNYFLDTALSTRRGIPLTLALLWMEVGKRAGIEVEGVGMPGHFLIYAGGQLVDPFHYGEAIGFDEAASLVAGALGGEPRADRSWFRPLRSAEVARRMLNNLENLYRSRGETENLEWVSACLETVSI